MGICICANCKQGINIDGGYGMFVIIRTHVAKAWDQEFGDHYATLTKASIHDKEFYNAFDKKANQILSDSRFKDEDSDILEFLFASDIDGSITYKTAKKIYNLIKDDNQHFGLGYFSPVRDVTHPLEANGFEQTASWDTFKEMLLQSYQKRCKVIWY